MSQLSPLESIESSSVESGERIGELAGFGSIFGIIAAVLGLLIGKSLIPFSSLRWDVTLVPSFDWIIEGSPYYHIAVGAFMGLIALMLLFQAIGSRDLGSYLGSGLINVKWLGFFLAAAIAVFVPIRFGGIFAESLIEGFLETMYILGAIFVISWQISSAIYTDSSKTWTGFLAGMLNALFIPVLAIGQAISPLLIYAAYIILIAGQVMSLLFWWSPFSTIREYARSTEKGKFAFGVTGVLTFVIGIPAVFIGPVGTIGDYAVWYPWSTLVDESTFLTNPALVYGLLAIMLYWIMLAPRLGARELKAAAIGEDIVKGANKLFMMFLAVFGLIAAGVAGLYTGDVGTWGFFLTMTPAGIMFLMGASYTAKTDIITGIPLVLTSIFIMVNPYVMFQLVLFPWFIIILTQIFLMAESWVRGLTGFSQAALTVLFSVLASLAIIIFILGGFGSGPLALWPTNRWFNITMLQGIPAYIQGPTIIVLPLLALLLRNVSLAGYSYGRGYATGGILVGASVLFAFIIPAIAGNQSVAHEANTGASLLLALYSMSVILVMSMNLSLANDVQETGHNFEGTLIKVATITGLIAAAIVVILVMLVFAGMPTPSQIALMVSIMVTFVVSSEILSMLGWSIAGLRLGMLREGFKFSKLK